MFCPFFLQNPDIRDLMDKCGHYGSDGDIDGVQQMIHKFGAEEVVNARYWHQKTCLHYAAEYGLPNIITLLVENGANLDPKDDYGETSLRLAIRWREYSSITTLIQLGADLEKAKESNFDQTEFDHSMSDRRTKAAIVEGQKLAGEQR